MLQHQLEQQKQLQQGKDPRLEGPSEATAHGFASIHQSASTATAAVSQNPPHKCISEIEECTEDEEEDGNVYGSGGLASTLSSSMPRARSSTTLSGLSQSFRREAPLRIYRVTRVGSDATPQIVPPEAQQQYQVHASADTGEESMRRSASGPALAVLLQQQQQQQQAARRGGAGGSNPHTWPDAAEPPHKPVTIRGGGRHDQGGCEEGGDFGFHSPKGMSKGSLSATMDRERAWASKEAEGGKLAKSGSAKFSFLGALLGGRSGASNTPTPDCTLHDGGSGAPLPHHNYRNSPHTHPTMPFTGSPTTEVSSVLGRASGSFFATRKPPLMPPKPPHASYPTAPSLSSPPSHSLGTSPPSRPLTPSHMPLLASQPASHHPLPSAPAGTHFDFRRSASSTGEGLAGAPLLPQAVQQQQQQAPHPGSKTTGAHHLHRQIAFACHSGIGPPPHPPEADAFGGHKAPAAMPGAAQAALLPQPPVPLAAHMPAMPLTPMQLMRAASRANTRSSVHGGEAFYYPSRTSQTGEGTSMHGGSSHVLRPSGSLSVHGGSQFYRHPPGGQPGLGRSTSFASMASVRHLQQQQQQQQAAGGGKKPSGSDAGFHTPKMMSGPNAPGRARISPHDIAVLASSLPSSFCYPRSGSQWSSRGEDRDGLIHMVDESLQAGNVYGSMARQAGRPSLSRQQSVGSNLGEMQAECGTEHTYGRVQPPMPICLICLEMLTPQDFETGEALTLQCLCKGELAMRHRACAIEWSNFKGDLTCDICKHEIQNLPPIDPAILAAREEARRRRMPNFNTSSQATFVDFLFDGIRVAWLVIIGCIFLRPQYPMSQTFIIGGLVGLVYTMLSLLLSCMVRGWRARRQRLQEEQQAEQAATGAAAQARMQAITTEALQAAAAAAVQRSVRGGRASGRGGGAPNGGSSYTLTEPLLIPGSTDNV